MNRSNFLDPDLLGQIAAIGVKSGRPMEGSIAGQHRSPLHGLSPEFADYRHYTPGDELKAIDWKVFGRSDRIYVKRFEEESNLRCYFVVDGSASMTYGEPLNKFTVAGRIASAIAGALLKQRDSIGLSVLSNQVDQELPTSSASSQLMRFVDILEKTKLAGETDLGKIVRALADRFSRRGMVVILSDLFTSLEDLYDALGKLQHLGHEILVLHVLHPEELELPFTSSVLFRDIEGTEEIFAEPWIFRDAYKKAMENFVSEVRTRCQYCGIDYLLVRTNQDLAKTLSAFFHSRALRGPVRKHGSMASLT